MTFELQQYLAIFHRITELTRLLEALRMTFGYIKALKQEIFASYKAQIVPLGRGRRKDSMWLWKGKRKGFFSTGKITHLFDECQINIIKHVTTNID